MCWICEQYGNGGLWYLNPKNFSKNLYKRKNPGEKPKAFGEDPELEAMPFMTALVKSKWEDPEHSKQRIAEFNARKDQYNQVIPLKDAHKMAELAYPIASMMCICRYQMRADEETNEHEYTCTGLGVGMFKWERWPERYRGGIHFMSVDEAKEWLNKMDKMGFVHTTMCMGGMYIGGLCNCDYPDCISIKFRTDYDIEGMLKSHSVAMVDYEKCNGCRICVQRCQFGALKFEVTVDKANIDMYRCYGCGLCETACPREAITLVDRESIPALKGVY